MIGRTFTRWLTAKRGDEDIAPPDAELATATLGIQSKQSPPRSGDKNALHRVREGRKILLATDDAYSLR
jgi:hypothetical protein